MPEDYPSLKAIYLERAKTTNERRLSYSYTIGAISFVGAVFFGAVGVFDQPYFLISLIGLVYSAVTIFFFTNGIRSFNALWKKNIAQFCEAIKGAEILRRVEEELYGDAIQYPDVVFTENYMITFKEFGDIYLVRDIDQVEVTEYRQRRSGMPDTFIYSLNCYSAARYAFLSSDEDHIREIFHEIRRRHPEVELTPSAHAYFFPTSVRVE
jgi:hypothetical protein